MPRTALSPAIQPEPSPCIPPDVSDEQRLRSELLDPRAQIEFLRPRAARLAMQCDISARYGLGLQQRVRAALRADLRVTGRVDLTVDDHVRHVNSFRAQLPRQALRHGTQRELRRGEIRKARAASQ